MRDSNRQVRLLLAVLVVVCGVVGAWWIKGSPQAVHRSAVEAVTSSGEPAIVHRVLRTSANDELEWLDGEAAKTAYDEAKAAVLTDSGAWEAHRTISIDNATAHEQLFPYAYTNSGARPEVTIPPGNTMWAVRITPPNGHLLDAYLISPLPSND